MASNPQRRTMKKDHLESNKFQGLRYYAISCNQEIIVEGSSPDEVYCKAIIKGENTPIIISSNTIIKTMDTLANKELIESSSLFLDLSKSLLNKLDLFLSNTNLDKEQQKQLMKIFEEIYSTGYENSTIDY